MARKGMRVITFTDPNPVSVDPFDSESLDSPCGELSVAEAKKFFMKGLRQGLRKGLSKKKSRIKPRKKREIARRLLAAGVEPQVIAEAMGLSRYELTALELEKVFGIEQNDSLLEGEVTSEFFELLSFAREMLRGGFSVTTLAELTALPAQVIDELKDERPAIKYSITEKGRRYLDQLGL